MSPTSTLARSIIVAALAFSAVGLGGCAETTSGQETPSMAHVPVAGYRLGNMTMPRVAPVTQTASVALPRQSSGRTGGVVASSGLEGR
jgi:hypothetical protein